MVGTFMVPRDHEGLVKFDVFRGFYVEINNFDPWGDSTPPVPMYASNHSGMQLA